jgi:hypothetical protein
VPRLLNSNNVQSFVTLSFVCPSLEETEPFFAGSAGVPAAFAESPVFRYVSLPFAVVFEETEPLFAGSAGVPARIRRRKV